VADHEQRRDERAPGEPELWLGELLDAAAEQYEPDTERLKAMVTARIARQSEDAEPSSHPSRRARRSGPRRRRGLGVIGRLGLAGIPAGVALTTVGAAAALAVGATATIAVTSSHPHHAVTVAGPSSTPGRGRPSSQTTDASSSPTPVSTGPATSVSATSGPSGSGQTTASGSPTGSMTTSALVAAAPTIDKASNSDWAQLDLTVDVKDPLTALHVTVKVSKCAGLGSTGSWDSGAIGQFAETTTTDSDGSITYEFELAQGDQVSPGTVTFAVQFNHAATGWNVADDTYYVSARTTTSTAAASIQGAYRG
jgi:hypothetical protein